MDQDKSAVRRAVRMRRAAVPASVRAERDRAIRDHLASVVTEGMVVCAFVPDDDEAGGPDLPETLALAGAHVLLPVSPAVGALGWAAYAGPADLRPGRFGIPVPSAAPEGPGRMNLPSSPSSRACISAGPEATRRGRRNYPGSQQCGRVGLRLGAVCDPGDVKLFVNRDHRSQ